MFFDEKADVKGDLSIQL